MQLTRTPVTNGPAWRASAPIPATLPQPRQAFPLRSTPVIFAGRTGDRNRVGTEELVLGSDEHGYLTHGSFDQAVAAARDLASVSESPATYAVVQGHAGWLLLQAGSMAGSTWDDDPRVTPFAFTRPGGEHATVARRSHDDLFALVGRSRWIDLR